jgi:preprotein translocase subunit SecG
MQSVIIVVHLLIVLAMIGVVLLQKSEGGGLGIGGGGSFLSTRGTANVLTRTTAYLAAIFFTTSFILSVLAGWGRQPASILRTERPAPTAPGPTTPSGGTIFDTLKQQTPSGPQVPQSK